MGRSHRLARIIASATAALAIGIGSLGLTGAAHAATVTVNALTPSSGPTTGGTQVSIYGSGFVGTISGIFFGGSESMSWSQQGGTVITAATPPHAAGVVDVTVRTTTDGDLVLPLAYTYGGPGAPTNVAAVATAGGADVSWTAPASDGGYALTSYLVYVRASGASTWTSYSTGSTATTYAVTGLAGGSTYSIAVRAVNVNGPGSWSNVTSVTTLGTASPPGAPQNLAATAGDGQVSLSWSAPGSDGGSPITRYEYSVFDGTSWTGFVTTGGTVTAYVVTGLANGTAYSFRVRAVSDAGAGTASDAASATPAAPSGGGSGGSGSTPDDAPPPASTGQPSAPATTPAPQPSPTPEPTRSPVAVATEHVILAVDDTVRYTELRGDTQSYPAPGLLANDSDTAGHSLSLRRGPLVGSNGGVLVVRKTGAFSYTPDPTATRLTRERFTITVVDSLGEVAESELTVLPNRAPVVPRAEYSVREGTTLRVGAANGVLDGAFDPDGDLFALRLSTVRTTSLRPRGSLTVEPSGALQYVPFPSTTSGSETFAVDVVDSHGLRTEARVTINIGPNSAPVVPATQYSLREGATLRVDAANGLLAAASDPDGDSISVKPYSAAPSSLRQGLGGLIASPSGAFTYQAFPGRTGLDSWSFDVVDAFGKRTVGRVSFTIVANQAPVVPPSRYTASRQSTLSVGAAQGLLAGASDPEGDAITVVLPPGSSELLHQSRVGVFSIRADGSFTYSPNPLSTAPSDSFAFTVTDALGRTSQSSVTITVTS